MVPGTWLNLQKTTPNVVPHDKPEWLDMMLDRANSMYQRDKNHAADPDLVLWK